jgi:signal transduction histidine kinase/ligand-binding sensor domain-containing protein/DNA-binding NarL/FixJ family response regulator
MKPIMLAFFLLLVQASSVLSQSVRELSTKDGLPQSFVSGLVQDDTSFVWIGTRNGLARYDGIQFKVFQHNPNDPHSLASNLIIWIKRDPQNQLWIEFETGEIDVMDPVTEKIKHFLKGNLPSGGGVHFVRRGWMVDSDGIFWGIVAGSGLNTYDSHTKKIEYFTRLSSGFPSDTVRGLVEIKNKGVWILSQQDISLYDKKTGQFIHWPLPFKQDFGNFPESNTIAFDLHERKNGEIMWGDRQRLFFFRPETHSFRSVSLPGLSYMGIRWIRTGIDGLDYFENYGKVYRYGDQKGLTSIGKTITEFFGDVKSFLVDHSGLIWLGTNAGGIHQIDLEIPFFQSFKYSKDFITDMLQQELGIDMRKMFNWTPKDDRFSPPSYHFRSVYDANNRLYLALKETVCYYDERQRKYISLPHVPVLNADQTGIYIKGITITPAGAPMLVSYNANVLTYDSTRRTWEQLLDTLQIRKAFGSLLTPQDVLADDSSIWITTVSDGLLRIDIHTRMVQQYKENSIPGSLPTNQLLGFRADPKHPDLLWIGSYQGLIRLNKRTLHFDLFGMKEGIPDNTIYSILSDGVGKLWLSTNKGICRFDPESHEVRPFHTEHGLPGDEFNRFHQLEFPDGRLAFGGTDGWILFDPRLIKNDDYEPSIAFTDCRINNKEISGLGKNSLPRLPLNSLTQLTLTYDQNTVSIGFAGLEFSQPQDLQYRYRLEGYDNDWVMAGKSHQANYTKIPPGNYTLLVNASNTTGKWSTHINGLKISIRPPWWSTPMAYLCYCIILAGLAWTFMRLRLARMLVLRDMELKEKEARQLKELDDMKSRFFSNITHEFRTPLTLIMGPAEQLKSSHSLAPQQTTRLADTIVKNAKQLLILINRLMDLSKLEAKALKLHEQSGNPGSVVGSVVHSFETDAGARQVQLSFEDQTGSLDCWFYGDALERIVYNLVSNALRFTQPGGNVEVVLSAKDKMLLLKVRDTGTGIPQNKLPRIFDRFYQAEENGGLANEELYQGTGIGLSMVKELMNQMEGKIKVESRTAAIGPLPSGTLFTLSLPYRTKEQGLLTTNPAIIPMTSPTTHPAANPPTDPTTDPPTDPPTGPTADPAEEGEASPDKRAQILLVEDSQELAEFVTGVLSGQYQVTHVLNGALGVDQTLATMPDLIISDVMMPVMDGYEFCARVKEDIRTSHIPVILLTAKVSQENVIEGLTKGADDYLTKPFHPTELLLRIHNLLDRQQKLRELIRRELALPVTSVADQQPVVQDIFVAKLYELVDEHLDDSYFGVDQLVTMMNISRSSLHRKLKSITGLSTSEVVRNYRLKKASLFLKEGFNSSDTAYKAGFGSPAYFTKCFREIYGMTPGEFIRQAKN